MITDGRISRVDVGSGPFRTAEGLGIGSTEAQIYNVYGASVHSDQNQYTATAKH